MLVAQPERTGEPPGFEVARADTVHFALVHEISERVERLLERCLGVGLVHEIEIEPLGVESRQACVDLALDMAARQAAVVRPIPDGVEHFRAQKKLIANARVLCFRPASDERLARAAAIGVGSVEEIDAELERAVHEPERILLAFPHAEKA